VWQEEACSHLEIEAGRWRDAGRSGQVGRSVGR
jgi:hypothetical protein